MFCVYCGKTTVADAVFCAHCGREVRIAAESSEPSSTPATTSTAAVSLEVDFERPPYRGWFQLPGDPDGVERWFDGKHWTNDLTGGSADDRERAHRLILPRTAKPSTMTWRVPAAPGAGPPANSFGRRLDTFASGVGRPEQRGGRRRPGQVTAAAVLLFVLGGLNVLGALLFLALGSISGAFALVGVILLAVGGIEIWAGVAMLQLQPWARLTGIWLALIGGVLAVISLVNGATVSILGIGVDVVVLILLLQEEVRRAFLDRT